MSEKFHCVTNQSSKIGSLTNGEKITQSLKINLKCVHVCVCGYRVDSSLYDFSSLLTITMIFIIRKSSISHQFYKLVADCFFVFELKRQ
jgi:hypothetical protein